MTTLVIAKRYVPHKHDKKMDLRLAVDTKDASLKIVGIRDNKLAVLETLSDAMCRIRGVTPFPAELLRDAPALLRSIPDGDYVRLLVGSGSDAVDLLPQLHASDPPQYEMVPLEEIKPTAPSKVHDLLIVSFTDEEAPKSKYFKDQDKLFLAHAGRELKRLREEMRDEDKRINGRTHVRLTLLALQRAAEIMDTCSLTVAMREGVETKQV